MDKDRELAGQVDALLGRHGRASDQPDDRNVPVLTDLVAAPDWTPAANVPATPSAQPAPAAGASSLLKQLSEQEIDALSNDIFTRVLERIDHSLASKLEDHIAAQLSTQINSAITHVISDMRQDIANEIGDAVNAALADKLRQQ
jgi:hypothetical protein